MKYSLKELGLVDAPAEAAFDNLTKLAKSLFSTEISLVSIVEFENNRQYFKSQQGLSGQFAEKRETPLTHAFCQHVVRDMATVIVDDKSRHPEFKDYPDIPDLNITAYLGAPIYDPQREAIGAFCVIDSEARRWSSEQIEQLEQLSDCVSDAIRLKAANLDSERLRMEQAEFTYAISHDLKSPVNTLNLLLNELAIISTSDDAKEHRVFLDRSLQTINRMGNLIEDILDYTRICAVGSAPTEAVPLSLVIEEIAEDMATDLLACGGTITVGELPTIQANPMHLRILFQNLISNALKFRRKGVPPVVTLSAESASKGSRQTIVVADNGIGIAVAHQEKIFKVFTRLHNDTEYAGTGLGLALCHRIVASYEGKVTVDSIQGSGSEFSVVLPGEVK